MPDGILINEELYSKFISIAVRELGELIFEKRFHLYIYKKRL